MILVVCLDNDLGMAFNKRRQTRDKRQRAHLLKQLGDRELYLLPYSEKLFSEDIKESNGKIHVVEDPLMLSEEVLKNAVVFTEREAIGAYLEKADSIYVYRWNRKYLSDVRFPNDGLLSMNCVHKESFPGTSHDRITFEVYEK